MDFFKSVFSDETPDSPSHESLPPRTLTAPTPDSPSSSTSAAASSGGWSFGGLIQTLSSKSESVIETYRRDLQEFTTGLKSETQVLKHVASTSLDVGAAKAQVSLESVGQAFDSLGSAVSDIIFDGGDAEVPQSPPTSRTSHDVSGVKYSRFDAQLRRIQVDESTFTEDPAEEGEKSEFEKWKLGFDSGDYTTEVEDLLGSGVDFKLMYDRIVPSFVDHETFWLRYFYRVQRLKQAEHVRARLVKRAIEADDDEEELSWDVDDEDDTTVEKDTDQKDVNVSKEDREGTVTSTDEKEGDNRVENESVEVEEKEEEAEKVEEGKGEASETSKDSDISVVSSQQLGQEEEDMGWDEIEDVGSGDDEVNKGSNPLGSPIRAELRKRLSTAEDDEDLSWDIEDDDEPIKK